MDPSNTNLFGQGQINLIPDFTRQVLKLCVHYTTIHLSPQETKELAYKVLLGGKKIFGDQWALDTYQEIGTIPCKPPEISIPSGDQVQMGGETEVGY